MSENGQAVQGLKLTAMINELVYQLVNKLDKLGVREFRQAVQLAAKMNE